MRLKHNHQKSWKYLASVNVPNVEERGRIKDDDWNALAHGNR
jgi:hypothetical protein